jgi:hypothetical protein
MALTRIKTNQITDGAVTSAKLAANSVTAGKLANNLTYGSDFTVTGNLTVSGTTTSVSTTNTRVEDAIIALSAEATGSASVDSGLLINRGADDNQAMIWDESEDRFVFANVGAEDGDTAGNVTISSYAPVQMGALTVTTINASSTITGDVTGDLTGNADTATALATARAIALAGDVVGTVNFDGTGDVSITTAIQANSVALGTDTTGDYTATITGGNGIASSGATSGEGIAHTLSVDLTDTNIFASDGTASRAVVLDGSGDFTANMITSDLTGDVTGTADVATSITATANDSTNETVYLTFVDGQTGAQGIETDLGLVYNPSTGALTSTSFVGALTGTADDADALSSAVTVQLTGDVTGSATFTSAGDTASISTTIAANSVALGTDTTGNYVQSLADAGNSFFTITNGTAEGGAATIDLVAGSITLGTDTTGNYVGTITGGNGIASSGATTGEGIAHSLSVDLTDTNIFASDGTVSRAVVLDGSGDFSAGTITANIDGIIGGNTTAAGTFTTVTANTSATLASAKVSDLTSGRIVLAGTAGELEDSANLTFNGSTLAVTGAATISTSLGVTGTTSLNGAVNLGDASGDVISVTGTATFAESADFDGGFTVAASQTIDVGANKITNMADPASAQDAATKAYVDSEVSSGSTLAIAGDSGTDNVIVGTNTFTFSGTANEVTTAVTDNTLTIGLPSDVHISNDLTIAGNLTVSGTTTTLSTTNSVVEDSLIEINTGATSNANDLGFIFERGSTGDNAVFAWDESVDKFTLGTTTATGASTGDLTISAGTLVAALEGNASTATALATARNIAIAGDVVGTASFDGTGDISITATIQADSVALGTDTTGNYVQSIADAGSSQFTITNGTAEGGAATIALANNAVTLGTHTAGNYVATLQDAGNSFFTIANSGSESAAVTIDLVAGSVTLGTHTSGDFVGTITGGAGIASTGATTGEDTDHSLSVDLTDTSVFNSNGTVSTAVVLDGSGDFSANMITSDLTGDVTGTADVATSVTATANDATNESVFITFVDGQTGAQGIETDIGLVYNPSTGALTSTSFVGGLTGTADVATSITAVANNSTDESVFLTFVDGATGTQGIETDTGLTYNPLNNVLTTTTFSGALSGNATTASALATARAIALDGAVTGTANFDGSAAINIVTTATADPTITLAGDLTGSVTLTNLGDGTLTATIAANSVALGTDTTGNYMSDTTGGNGITVTHTPAEGSSAAIAVDLTDTNVFNSDGTVSTAVVLDASGDFTARNITATDIDGILGSNTAAAATVTTLNASDLASLDGGIDVDGAFVVANTSGNITTTGTAIIGSATATSDVTLKVDATDSMMIPVGTTGDRPTTGVTGMFRFNTTTGGLEYHDGSSWEGVSSDFTLASSQTFSGDDSTTAFTLSSLTGSDSYTVAGVLVMLNGVVQEPTTVYGISGTTLTFTTAPATGDLIEVRKFTTTTTVTALADLDGDTQIQLEESADEDIIRFDIAGSEKMTLSATQLSVTGNIVATGNITANGDITLGDANTDTITLGAEIGSDIIPDTDGSRDLGSAANRWAEAHIDDVLLGPQGDIRFYDSDASNFVAFQSAGTVASDITWTLPNADAAVSGYALVSDASGTLSWAAAGATTTSDTTTNAEEQLYFGDITSGAVTAVHHDADLTYNPSTGSLSSDVFIGALTGNADTATALETARTIAGNSFDGTANITIASTQLSDSADLARLAAPAFTGVPTAPTAAANTNTTQIATTAYVQTEITDLIGGAPGALDTLNELAAAINDDSSFASTVTTSLGGKVGTTSNQALSTAANVLTNSGATISLARASGDTDSVTLTLADLGYSGATNANYITNNNQLTNGAGYTTNTGDITNVSVSGSGLSGGGASGSVTITSNATSANTGNTIVFRDGSGNFSAGLITGTSTAARYADLAEMYAADAEIEPGTVVHFAGDGKVAACDVANCRAVAGIISTDPAHLMNSDQEGVALALAGRVPCKVTGPVAAGDLMVSAGNGMAMANNEAAMGTVIGKAIEANEGGEGVIEVLALMM